MTAINANQNDTKSAHVRNVAIYEWSEKTNQKLSCANHARTKANQNLNEIIGIRVATRK